MSRSTDGNSQKKSGMTDHEKGLPLFREQGLVDGRGEDEADRREVGRQQVRVMAAVADYMGSRNRRGKRRHAR